MNTYPNNSQLSTIDLHEQIMKDEYLQYFVLKEHPDLQIGSRWKIVSLDFGTPEDVIITGYQINKGLVVTYTNKKLYNWFRYLAPPQVFKKLYKPFKDVK